MILALNACAIGASIQENRATSSKRNCSEVTGLSAVFPASILIFGEYHGSNEIPIKFSHVVCQFRNARPKEKILIGLELPIEFDQIFINMKAVAPVDAAKMIDQLPFWRNFGDGRHSDAMRKLTHTLMAYSYESNGHIEIVGYQRKKIDSAGAEVILARMLELKADRVILLTGNGHARKSSGLKGPPHPPMGENLLTSGKKVISLDIRYSQGDAWVCLPECAKRKLPVIPVRDKSDIVIGQGIADGAYDGYYYIQNLTISDSVNFGSAHK